MADLENQVHVAKFTTIIGASLSEPHINGTPMHNPYIFIYIVVRRSYQLRITVYIHLKYAQ